MTRRLLTTRTESGITPPHENVPGNDPVMIAPPPGNVRGDRTGRPVMATEGGPHHRPNEPWGGGVVAPAAEAGAGDVHRDA